LNFLRATKIKKNLKTKYYEELESINYILYNSGITDKEKYKINYGGWKPY
jgi:hypothetical protein